MTTLGAYGLTLDGFGASGLVPSPSTWPHADLTFELGDPSPKPFELSTEEARLSLIGGGQWSLRRDGLRGTLTAPRSPDPDVLAHPILAGAACVFAYWLGHEVFHSGAFVADGAWGLLGDKEAGKTTLLAQLHAYGLGVVADDMLVIDHRGMALEAPRCLDLRADAADHLEASTHVVRSGERRRVVLPPVEPELPFRGWIALSRGDELSIERVPPHDRLAMLSDARTLRVVPRDPGVVIRLAGLPCYRLRRPFGWGASSGVIPRLLDVIT